MKNDGTTIQTNTQSKADAYEFAKNTFINALKNACNNVKGQSSYLYKVSPEILPQAVVKAFIKVVFAAL